MIVRSATRVTLRRFLSDSSGITAPIIVPDLNPARKAREFQVNSGNCYLTEAQQARWNGPCPRRRGSVTAGPSGAEELFVPRTTRRRTVR